MFKSSKPQSLETYLAQIAHELRGLPLQARADEMREIEAHLSALVLASEQLEDISGAEATATATRQFGEPRATGRKLRKAWERKQPEAWWRVASAPVFAMAFSAYFAEPFTQGFFNFDPTASMASIVSVSSLLTFVTAYIMGLISPKRTKLMVSVFASFVLVSTVLDGILLSSLWALASFFSFAVSAIVGAHFGASHIRKLSSQIADVN